MKCRIYEKSFFLISCTFVYGLPSVVFADATDSSRGHHGNETNIQIDYISLGDSKSSIGSAQVGTTGVRIESEYEMDGVTFLFGYERWKYDWTNPESLPFISEMGRAPWSTFNTLQFGFAYEQEINDTWELNYYVEAESSFEKETSASREYETGVDITYEPSAEWSFTLNINLEYLDATGSEIGADVEVEWRHDSKDGWSAELEIGGDLPETTLTYHFFPTISASMFYNERGTSLIRLSDSSPVTGSQGGYLEDEYASFGLQLNYEFAYESYLTFSVQQNTGRSFTIVDRLGVGGQEFEFANAVGATIGFSYTF